MRILKWCLFTATIVGLAVVSIPYCPFLKYQMMPTADGLEQRLVDAANEQAATIELGRLTDFEWDRVVIVGPYQRTDDCADLTAQELSLENDSDGSCILIFLRGPDAVAKLVHPRAEVDFATNDGPPVTLPRSDAIFAVDRSRQPRMLVTAAVSSAGK